MPVLAGRLLPVIVMVGAVVKATLPLRFKGATVRLGVSAPKLNCKPELIPPLFTVRVEIVHCLVISVTDTPKVAVLPVAAASVTALFEQEPPVTPKRVPALIVVGP